MDLALNGKRALVTGASKGLGLAVARALLAEGAEVVISSRFEPNLYEARTMLTGEIGVTPTAITADLTNADDRARLVETAYDLLGGLDILLVNAGGPPPGPFLSHDPSHWQLAIELALGSMTHLCRLVVPKMKEQRFGRIAQIVSIAGLEVIEGLILSNASRPAVLGFAKALAREVAGDGILVNSICPGIFHTSRIDELAAEESERLGVAKQDYLKSLSDQIPLGRPGNPNELGDLAAYLLSPRNTYITGAAIPIDGAKTVRLY